MNKPKDIREELMDHFLADYDRLIDHYQEHFDYWYNRCMKAEDDLGVAEERLAATEKLYEALLKTTKTTAAKGASECANTQRIPQTI